MNDIELAFKTITDKRSDLDLMWNYTNGPQPLKYSTERLEDAFDDIKVHFEINWCSVIVDATLDRIQLLGFDTEDETANEILGYIFDKLHLDLEAHKTHNSALATTQGYLIIWKTDAEIEVYYNDPRMCAVIYESARPNVKRFAVKNFIRDDGKNEITLYYTDQLEHWTSPKAENDKASAYMLESTEANPFGVIPVFELRSPGEFIKVITLQDAINKLFADMMVSAEFGSWMQRYVISNSDPGNLKNSPGEIWWLPSGDGAGQQTSVGQFQSADLQNYLNSMEVLANNMAIITRTPKHYLMTTGANISGEALLALESPLVKKVKLRQREFAAVWQDIAKFILQLNGMEMDASEISVMWERPESVQPLTEAQIRQTAVNTGIPLITVLKKEGWTDEEITAMEDDQALQDKARQTVAQAVLNDLRTRQEQMNPPQENNATVGQ
mgnify:CR=1 FL=1